MYSLARKALFFLEPEKSHSVAKVAISSGIFRSQISDERLNTSLNGIQITNPVGLAAGFDKDCEMFGGLAKMGFGFVTVGSITRERREGNPKPRIVRYQSDEAIVNAMGLPSKGLDYCVSRLGVAEKPVIASIASFDPAGIPFLHKSIEPLVSGVEINISSPTFRGTLEDADIVSSALSQIRNEKPLFLKIPHYAEKERDSIFSIIDRCKNAAIVAGNTRKVEDSSIAVGYGGLSGKPIRERTLRIVKDVFDYTSGKTDIISCGGIFSGSDAYNALSAGASAVEIYTSFIYRGPFAASMINRELLKIMETKKISSIGEIRKA